MTVVHPAFDLSNALGRSRPATSARHTAFSQPSSAGEIRQTRAALRVQRRRQERRDRIRRSPLGLVLVWWFYPLMAAVALCLTAGVLAAQAPKPVPGSIVVQLPSSEG